jgi:hypothetical protein
MIKKPVAILLALAVLFVTGFIVYSQMNKNRQIVDMFDNPNEAIYEKIVEWSANYDSLEKAKSVHKFTAMTPSDTAGKNLKKVYVKRSTMAAQKSYILEYEGLRIEAFMGPSTAEQGVNNVMTVIGQFGTKAEETSIHGVFAMATPENETSSNGILYKIPAAISWWENGFTYLAIAKGMSVDDLKKVCESATLK